MYDIFMIYKGRYIKKFKPGIFIVAWSAGSSGRAVFNGSLAQLKQAIDETVSFWGKWEYLF